MCLALPAQVIRILDEQRAVVSIGGVEKEIATLLLEQVRVGDYVILHVGYALTKLNEQEAQKTLALFANMMQGAQEA
ncbi:HypC/HybG/HupF family hydrogenase formation chaperone [Legionella oakridgensis]|uniref:Hydrogenase assembly chaperone HypC n=2 Tax=Legionella oakridgensis TaxID=29423 RepID=W0BHY0_9GAMM|nr:HypC/HybG/HupF family hydrogenase formation chaperone [Legionella oakridgensis]AHE68024.1 hydrogenase assembly chaperone HypC [Legionella oakridgensis ATCC 33761 = DSM 21215]ETO92452.1 hydrogenase maturation protein HypC [Legionella oakridgensis RV-2-2007]KTD44576.1 hydrogenase expression/formation protein HypC [Legionella oakridgensis]STY21013.1 hydrogenase expression/formation protein HypC [Legionella longbeachae]